MERASTLLEAPGALARTDGDLEVARNQTARIERSSSRVAALRGRGRAPAAPADFRRWSRRYQQLLIGAEALIGLAAILVAATFSTANRPNSLTTWAMLAIIGAIAWPAWIAGSQGYSRSNLSTSHKDLRAVIKAAIVVIMVVALPAAWLSLDGLVNSVAIAVPLAAITSVGIRFASKHRVLGKARRSGSLRRVIMVGSPESVQELMTSVESEPALNLRVAGVCVPEADMDRARAMGLPLVGDLDHVADWALRLDCHAVAVSGPDAGHQDFLRRLAWSLEDIDTDVLIHTGLTEVAPKRVQVHGTTRLPLLRIRQPYFTGLHRVIKRAVDISLTSVGLLALLPFLGLIALLIKLDDPEGPVIFRQSRIGLDGIPFTMYKFRSMCTDAEAKLANLMKMNEGAGPLFKLEHDPRVTRVGRVLRKYSLDELPQFFNVLLGNMSIVGPRPPLQSEVNEYGPDVYRRLKVIPGITGLWQVSGRSLLSWEESVRLDLRYVENWSIGLDLAIMIKTAQAVVANRGAF